ncbi:MAG TPA: hypothetical protein VJH94_05170 [Candidatus Paceibacterota bacterium]
MEKPDKKRPFSFGKLTNVEKSLYARHEFTIPKETDDLPTPSPSDVPSEWKEEEPQGFGRYEHLLSKSGPIMKKILIAAIGFFLVSGAFAAYVFFGGLNRVSTDNIEIAVTGPSSIGAGEPLSFEFTIKNKNNVDLEVAHLLVEYPIGSRTADQSLSELLRESESLGTIDAGASMTRTKQVTLFGEADSTQRIIISLEYRVKDSSATYFKEQNYDVIISTSPVRMTINSVKEAVSGNEMEISVEVVSNSATIVSGLMLKVDYPFGFTFSTASPVPTFGNNTFMLGDLNPADRRIIRIRGKVTGQEGEDRLFRVTLGLPDKRDNRQIGTVFLSSTESIAIKRPFVSASLSLNGSSDDVFTIEAGQSVRGEIAWTNNLPSRIVDLEIQVKLTGSSLNRLSISSQSGGFYRSIDNIIIWDKTTSGNFAVVEPGESGVASFTFSSLPVSSLLYSGARGNEISIDVSIQARRLSDVSVSEQISSGTSKKVRISSNLALTGRSLYYSGPFSNQGPIPPVVERNTTYTLVWSLTNTLNSASGIKVEAVLPGYISWLNNVSAGESVRFDPATRRVVWDVGDVPATAGFSGPPREVSFQVSFVPSLSQRETSPTLLGESVVTGVDRYNSASLRASAPVVTTRISDGDQKIDQGKVQQQ